MNLFVLSESHLDNHVSWAMVSALEETIAATCNPTFLYPHFNDKIKVLNGWQISDAPALRRYRHRLFKSWFTLDQLPQLGQSTNVLLVLALRPANLLTLHALGSQLKHFDLKIGYIMDGFDLAEIDRSVITQLDHLFVISAALADQLNHLGKVPTSFLPLAVNTLKRSSQNLQRSIDIISYGRVNPDVHSTLQSHVNRIENGSQSHRLYFHSTFASGAITHKDEHMTLLFKMLSRSKISLCFEASNLPRFRGDSPLLYRWFEAWAAGCTIVGKKPFGAGVAELMDWQNSTIELPDSSTDWIPFLEELLDDEEFLAQNTQRNYKESLHRHDWRYRLQQIFQTFGLPLPEKLESEIAQLRQRTREVSQKQICA